MPSVIAATARQVVDAAGATTPYAKAEALRDYFWANYTYDLNVDPNDDTNAIAKFLDTSIAASACSSRAPTR